MKSKRFSTLWFARVLAIVFALFLMIFSFDVFGGSDPFYMQLLGFFIHNVPTIVLLAITIAFWNRPKFAGLTFLILCAVFTIFFKTYEFWASLLTISGIPFLIAVLFLISANPSGPGTRRKRTR